MPRTRGASPGPEFVDPGPPGAWADRASCKGTPVLLIDYFGKKRVDWGASKVVCRGCPVRRECLTYALELGAVDGVWGGLDPLELRFVLGRDATGELWSYTRQEVKCPMCRGATTSTQTSPTTALRTCSECHYQWVRSELEKRPRRRRRTV